MKEQQLYPADTIILFVGDFFNVKKLNFSFNHLMYEIISFSVLSYCQRYTKGIQQQNFDIQVKEQKIK